MNNDDMIRVSTKELQQHEAEVRARSEAKDARIIELEDKLKRAVNALGSARQHMWSIEDSFGKDQKMAMKEMKAWQNTYDDFIDELLEDETLHEDEDDDEGDDD